MEWAYFNKCKHQSCESDVRLMQEHLITRQRETAPYAVIAATADADALSKAA
jgi:hypothetical protein